MVPCSVPTTFTLSQVTRAIPENGAPHPYTRIGIFHLHPAHIILILAVLGLSQDYLIPWQTLCQSIPECRSYIGSPGIVQRLPTPLGPCVRVSQNTGVAKKGSPRIIRGLPSPLPCVRNTGVTLAVLRDYIPNSLGLCLSYTVVHVHCTLALIFCLILLLYPCITGLCLTFEMEVGYLGMAICA